MNMMWIDLRFFVASVVLLVPAFLLKFSGFLSPFPLPYTRETIHWYLLWSSKPVRQYTLIPVMF